MVTFLLISFLIINQVFLRIHYIFHLNNFQHFLTQSNRTRRSTISLESEKILIPLPVFTLGS
jgi:hypothetical protein